MTDLTPHFHQPRNVNYLHKAEIAAGSINQRIAVGITKAVGSMPCAYFFLILATLGFPGLHAPLPQYVQWVSQTCLQLVFLPIITVGQHTLARHAELQAEEQFRMTQKICHDNAVIISLLQQKTSEVPHD